MSNGKRQDGGDPSASSVRAPSSTITGRPSSTSTPIEVPSSVLGGLPKSTPSGLPTTLLTLSSKNTKSSKTQSTKTELVTIFTGQATPSIFVTAVTVATIATTTVSVTPSQLVRPTGLPLTLAQAQSAQVSLLHKCIIVGSVLGGVTLLLLIALAVGYCLYKRRRERRIRRHLGFDPNDSPPLTSLAPLPPTSPGVPRGAGTHLSTGPRTYSGVGLGIASTMGGEAPAQIGLAYSRDQPSSGGEQDSSASINTFGTRPRNSGPILTRPSPPSSPPRSPPRSPLRPPRPEREVHFAHVPAIAITPSTPSMRGSGERRYGENMPTIREPVTPPQDQMRSVHDGSPRFFPLTNTSRLEESSPAPRIPSLGIQTNEGQRIVSSLYSTDDFGLGNLMPGSGVSDRVHETRASSGVFPEPGERDDDDDDDDEYDHGEQQQGTVRSRGS